MSIIGNEFNLFNEKKHLENLEKIQKIKTEREFQNKNLVKEIIPYKEEENEKSLNKVIKYLQNGFSVLEEKKHKLKFVINFEKQKFETKNVFFSHMENFFLEIEKIKKFFENNLKIFYNNEIKDKFFKIYMFLDDEIKFLKSKITDLEKKLNFKTTKNSENYKIINNRLKKNLMKFKKIIKKKENVIKKLKSEKIRIKTFFQISELKNFDLFFKNSHLIKKLDNLSNKKEKNFDSDFYPDLKKITVSKNFKKKLDTIFSQKKFFNENNKEIFDLDKKIENINSSLLNLSSNLLSFKFKNKNCKNDHKKHSINEKIFDLQTNLKKLKEEKNIFKEKIETKKKDFFVIKKENLKKLKYCNKLRRFELMKLKKKKNKENLLINNIKEKNTDFFSKIKF